MGPLFTPPTLEGTLGLPGPGGGTNWPGAALDPETGILYVPSESGLGAFTVTQPDAARSDLRYMTSWFSRGPDRTGLRHLPLVKPPYSRVTAIDLNTGEHLWMTPHGDGPRTNPAIAHLELPPLGEVGGTGGPLVTKTLLFVSQRTADLPGPSSGPKLTVFDKKTGAILGNIPLPDEPYGNPITYLHNGKQYIAITVGGGRFMGGGGTPPKLVALALRD
jgi:quinoprotein glucose dehydrogenase